MAASNSLPGGRPLSVEEFARVEALFTETCALDAAERSRALHDACRDRPDLRSEVEALLHAHDRVAAAAWDDAPSRSSLTVGSLVGAYRLIEKIGDGGMGEVYRGERADGSFVQQVAVKIMRAAISQPDLLRRFKGERQILASLHHPNIVTLLDGGTTPEGQAYLVMEYVEGTPLTHYCRDGRSSLEEHLGIFRQVCAAVQYAHLHGIVHRDLKPGNILVTQNGVAKVLDFGVAKLLERPAEDGVTTAGVLPAALTPNYASPEQLRGLPVTTTSDVYALGVLLYELLSGVRPYETQGQPLDRILELVLHSQPVRPSAAVPAASADTPYPRRRLRGDLDAIVLKTMSKDAADRYISVGELASDIARFLNGEPVLARPPSAGYVLRRLAARHKPLVSVTALALAAILTALGMALWQARIARAERDRAQNETVKAQQTARFLGAVFQSANPVEARGDAVTARELLDRGTAAIATELPNQPDVQAALLMVMADAYDRLDIGAKALDVAERSLALRERVLPPDSLEIAESLHKVARLHRRQGRPARAIPLFQRALRIREAVLAPDHRELSATLRELALSLSDAGDLTAPGAIFERAIAIEERAAPRRSSLALLYNNLGNWLNAAGDVTAARAAFERSIGIYEQTTGAEQWGVAMPLLSFGMLLRQQEEFAAARPLFERALRIDDETFGTESAGSAYTLARLGDLAHAEGDLATARTLLDRSLVLMAKAYPPDHPEVAPPLMYLGRLLLTQGQPTEALPLLARALRIREQVHGEHPKVAEVLIDMAQARRAANDPAVAEQLLRRAVGIQRRTLPPTHPSLVATLTSLGGLRVTAGDVSEGTRLLEEAVRIARARFPASHSVRRRAEGALQAVQAQANNRQ